MSVSNGPHQTVQLGHRALAARLADVPDFDTALATSVDMTCGVANGHGAHHLTVAQRVDLTGVARNTRTDQGVGREGHRLHLTISADMEGVRPDAKKRGACRCFSFYWRHLKDMQQDTHGLPPEMDVRLAGRPGALMWV